VCVFHLCQLPLSRPCTLPMPPSLLASLTLTKMQGTVASMIVWGCTIDFYRQIRNKWFLTGGGRQCDTLVMAFLYVEMVLLHLAPALRQTLRPVVWLYEPRK
jgi:hypothetical protein